ncbi:outer membrane protein assembly factor BamC [Caldimonas tepidiphila]|uniref:outer membrane protein assembly factor BamC n=1 Tax=Caldimonas tepidiphila TaxID=2315841 RepID=UPI003AF3C0A4
MSLTALSRARGPRLALLSLAVAAVAGCSSVGSALQGDRVDYRSAGAKSVSLEVPPDLTQLAKEQRYQTDPGTGAVSASAYQAAPVGIPGASPTQQVAVQALGNARIERAGSQRWLVTALPPEQLWPQVRAFWLDNGFALSTEQPETGVMETDWAENRAKVSDGAIRNALSRVLGSLYSTGERDRFRTRIERAPGGGSEVYISHRGLEEVYTNAQRDTTRWQPRAADPQLEAEMLSRLLVKLGAKPEQAQSVVANAPQPPQRARVVNTGGQPAVQLDEGFDRAWRRVGLALDRSGFTVEDRNRAQGLYFVRYVAPDAADGEKPGVIGRLLGRKAGENQAQRYRIAVRGEGERSTVTVLDEKGGTAAARAAQRIVSRLADDLK